MKVVWRDLLLTLFFLTQMTWGQELNQTLQSTGAVDVSINSAGRLLLNTRWDGSLVSRLIAPRRGVFDWGRLEISAGANVFHLPHLPNAQRYDVDFFRLQVLRQAHFHFLGLERNISQGTALGVEVIGGYLPIPIFGHSGERTWGMFRVGLNLNYQWLLQSLGATADSHGGSTVLVMRFDEQWQALNRLQIRFFQEASYRAYLGYSQAAAQIVSAHQLSLQAGGTVLYDVTQSSPQGIVRRSSDRRHSMNTVITPDPRIYIVLIDIRGQWRIFDTITSNPSVATASAGAEMHFK